MNAREPKPASALREQRTQRHNAHYGRGVAMRVLALERFGGTLARCAGTDGIAATVETTLVGPVEPGAVLLVHAGLALARLDTEWGM